MRNDLLKKVAETRQTAQVELDKLLPAERACLEKAWDLEHTYYSSALEGSRIDRSEVERLVNAA